MSKLRHTLQLLHRGALSTRQIGAALGISKSTVSEIASYARVAGVDWALAQSLSDEELQARLYKPPVARESRHLEPDHAHIHRELRRPGVTLQLLWEEYQQQHSGQAYKYSAFCEKYKAWARRLQRSMRQTHTGGDKLFVDYAGQTREVVDPVTGAIRQAQIFVAVLGASNYTYAEATWSQQIEDWIGSHVRALAFFGGVPEAIVPDNLKSGVNKACRYEPDINPTYHDLARHYQTVVLPARVRKPRDKAKAEAGVLLVERWILARLRKHTFFSLAELNREITRLLQRLNTHPFKKLPGSRQSCFAQLDRPALKPLPPVPYELARWKKATVHLDYHVEVEGHYYSVPYRLVKKQVDIRYTATTVECLYRGERVASHPRLDQRGRHTTIKEHMPIQHQQYQEWTPARFIRWATTIGPETARLTETLLANRAHPQQAYRSLLGILRLAKSYDKSRLEAACSRALRINALSYRSIESILKSGLDRTALPEAPANGPPVEHDNIRGAAYYSSSVH